MGRPKLQDGLAKRQVSLAIQGSVLEEMKKHNPNVSVYMESLIISDLESKKRAKARLLKSINNPKRKAD